MTLTETKPVLLDHVEVRIVNLDPDHPGFRDAEYRARRNAIAQIATNYRPGQPIPHAPYTELEHKVWQTIWRALGRTQCQRRLPDGAGAAGRGSRTRAGRGRAALARP